jgi:class 3 adenylate cyclase
MAFWGAPDAQGDHAERACRAALAIAAALEAHNSALPEGTEPVRVRIGISTGRVLVGNIGAPGRVNFTLVGDVVNLAERLEQLGKEMDGSGPQILLSDATRAALPPDMDLDDIGERAVRGRGEAVRVWRLRLSRDSLTDVGFSSGGEASPEP